MSDEDEVNQTADLFETFKSRADTQWRSFGASENSEILDSRHTHTANCSAPMLDELILGSGGRSPQCLLEVCRFAFEHRVHCQTGDGDAA